jgi:hypothetical protein
MATGGHELNDLLLKAWKVIKFVRICEVSWKNLIWAVYNGVCEMTRVNSEYGDHRLTTISGGFRNSAQANLT